MTQLAQKGSHYRWEDVAACGFCGGTERTLYMESTVPHWYQRQPLRLEACVECGLVRASPRPTLEMLHGDYLAGGPAAQRAFKRKFERPMVRLYHRKEIKTASRFLGYRPERLYDMGCGAGTTLLEAQALGMEAWGNDINKAAVDRLNDMGCRVLHGFSKDLNLPLAYFDVVLNFDYLEHSYTPRDDLQKCFEITKPEGVLYLKTIYLDCPHHKQRGETWNMFGAGHFYYFTPDALQSMMESVGYEIVDVLLGNLIFIVARRPTDPSQPRTRPKPRVRGPLAQFVRSSTHKLINFALRSR